MTVLHFTVPGVAVPKGSHKMISDRRQGRRGKFRIVDQQGSDLTQWEADIATMGRSALSQATLPVFSVPVSLSATFRLPRPESAPRRAWPAVRPDLSKLVRALEDGMNGVVWEDDKLVCGYGHIWKRYADHDEEPGVDVLVEELA